MPLDCLYIVLQQRDELALHDIVWQVPKSELTTGNDASHFLQTLKRSGPEKLVNMTGSTVFRSKV